MKGHTSPETAYVVDDYPYGFRLRCKIRYWVETTKHGQRVVSQTTNPKVAGEVWNKPKASTYSPIRVLYLDDKGHVQNDGLTEFSDSPEIMGFMATHGDSLDDYQVALCNRVLSARALYAARQKGVGVAP